MSVCSGPGRLSGAHGTGRPLTLKSVAESGLATTSGEMRTMPEKWPGLSAAVRMEIAPPCGKRGRVVGVGTVVDPQAQSPYLGTGALKRWVNWAHGFSITRVSPGFSKHKCFERCK